MARALRSLSSSCLGKRYLHTSIVSYFPKICSGTKYDGILSANSFQKSNLGREGNLRSPLGGSIVNKQTSDLFLLSTSTSTQRHFASKSKGGDDDEDVLDDFESRLMGTDYRGDDMHMGDSSYGMGAANFEDYGEWSGTEDDSESEGEDDDGDSDDMEEDADDEDRDEDSEEEYANDQSDEDFEGERTDEELDELLANTPLFNPPELPEFVRPDEPDPEFSFRPEGPVYYPGMEYDPEELDITRPLPPRKREPRPKLEISVQEVIDKADFRNVRFLTKFISETGTIIARKEFKMRTKSHNRVVKAIKTARFFGLMPYTNMGRPKYVFNEPFDEFSEFYETDEDEKKLDDVAAGRNYQGSFGSYGPRNGNFSGQGWGGFGGSNSGRRL